MRTSFGTRKADSNLLACDLYLKGETKLHALSILLAKPEQSDELIVTEPVDHRQMASTR